LPKRFLKPIKILKENRKKKTKNNKEGNKNQRSAAELFIRRALIPYYEVDFKPNSTP